MPPLELGEMREFTHEGRPCRILKHKLGHWCGYAKTGIRNLTELTLNENGRSLLSVHGGLTYGVDEDGFVGFDCSHANDECVDEYGGRFGLQATDYGTRPLTTPNTWHLADVKVEVENLADQLTLLEQFARRADLPPGGCLADEVGPDPMKKPKKSFEPERLREYVDFSIDGVYMTEEGPRVDLRPAAETDE